MKNYVIRYKEESYSDFEEVAVEAKNKGDAYEIATYEIIPKLIDKALPYSSWVSRVVYSNGKVQWFNTCEGNAY